MLAILACTSSATHAQIYPFQAYRGPTLSRADLDAGTEAAGRLLGSDPKPVGTFEEWANPASGNSGTIAIERAYRRQGLDCRDVRSRVTYRTGRETSYLLRACLVSGRWKLVN